MKTTFLTLLGILFSIHYTVAQTVPLTFQVDMNNETVHPDGVHVAGTFQTSAGYGGNWDPGATSLMDNDGNGVYELTVEVSPGNYLYKFVNGDEWSEKPELPSEDCALNDGGGNFNRQVIVGSQGITLPIVQFDSCSAILYLSVNMKNETVSPDGVHVMGNFQEAAGFGANWNPATTPMVDQNGDGTYEIQIPVATGTYQYQFVNGNEANLAENPPTGCAVDDGAGNQVREATAQVGGAPGPIYCFNECTICDPAIDPDYVTHWWNDAVFYEIFVRSFYDSDGDGIGDFQGIIEKLDYLNDGDPNTNDDLGITGIWLMPMMESPSYHGYDVTDYYATEPDYGTMEDFEALLDAAHARGIKVIIDFVMNHSSSQHPWFTQSSNDQNGYRDWYIWSDTHPGFSGPWGQGVWHFNSGEYYYGLFWGGMPDLNYSHPPVKEELFNIAEFWLDKGVDGYRLDAIKYLDEDGSILENTPETFQLLEDFNDLYKANNPDAFTVGEVWSNTASILPYIQNDRLDVCFEFDLAYSIINGINGNNPAPIDAHFQTIQAGYPRLQYATFLTNHDIDRIYSQIGNDPLKMKLAASLYLTMPGIPFVYYGEELGMTGTGDHRNIRRPMQWANEVNAGFSSATPWAALGNNYQTNNVEDMQGNSSSLLRHYQKLIHIRNASAPLRRGYLLGVDHDHADALSYARIYEEEAVIVTSNMGTQAFSPVLSLAASSLPPGEYFVEELLSNSNFGTITINANGGFSNWQPSPNTLNARNTWVISIQSVVPVSTHESVSTDLNISLFPNPTSDRVHFVWEDSAVDFTEIQIFDVSGKLVKTHSFQGSQGELSVTGLPKGVSFLKIRRGEVVKMERLVVL